MAERDPPDRVSPSDATQTRDDSNALGVGAHASTDVARAKSGSEEPLVSTFGDEKLIRCVHSDCYALVGEHARGGLGRVLKAIDRSLGRSVAVKELLEASADT